MAGDWRFRENWRWDPDHHVRRTPPTIVVIELSKDARRSRQEKIDEGAEVVSFGFARAIPRRNDVDHAESSPDDDAWEGQGL